MVHVFGVSIAQNVNTGNQRKHNWQALGHCLCTMIPLWARRVAEPLTASLELLADLFVDAFVGKHVCDVPLPALHLFYHAIWAGLDELGEILLAERHLRHALG